MDRANPQPIHAGVQDAPGGGFSTILPARGRVRWKPTAEFRKLGFEPGLWQANDVVSRMAVFSMMTNLLSEVQRARLVDTYGAAAIEKWMPPDPFVKIEVPRELNLKEVRVGSLAAFEKAPKDNPHYADPIDDSANGRYDPMPFTQEAVEAATRERIFLTP